MDPLERTFGFQDSLLADESSLEDRPRRIKEATKKKKGFLYLSKIVEGFNGCIVSRDFGIMDKSLFYVESRYSPANTSILKRRTLVFFGRVGFSYNGLGI